jgi:hypothetical protein
MVGGKMCLTAGAAGMMCRIDPDIHETAIKRKGCRTVMMKGREYKGYVYVNENSLKTKGDFDYWVTLLLISIKKQGLQKRTRTEAHAPNANNVHCIVGYVQLNCFIKFELRTSYVVWFT